MTEWAFVALGSNLGDRAGYLAEARRRLATLPDTALLAESAVEETDPVGPVPQGPYLNQMVLLRTALSPRQLLEELLGIERAMGRSRTARWGPRTIDLDIVRFGTHVVEEADLRIPHPELPNRPFWQRELAELMSHAP
ncbi:MAG: 2-amino-4-hydroxy-6-hydroxymethyldihydropteridine diphosphokinase [Gemmatimonadetes bacterium]|nr:2-amino-4-hydroxy-6-hydroxymethyldihydropteridine diphosphokinase [Gemmatimonadota bacterium]